MVKLHIKIGDENQFLYESTVNVKILDLIEQLVKIQNGRMKVQRVCQEMEGLRDHGVSRPPNMQGLLEDQIYELKLVDEWSEKCEPSGGGMTNGDMMGRRCGISPNEKMKEIMTRTISDALLKVSKKQADEGKVCLTDQMVNLALDELRGAVMIVYPMGLPPHDPIDMEFRGLEVLDGTQAEKEVFDAVETELWWANKQLDPHKTLKDYVGTNEKTKIITKLQKRGRGAPSREAAYSEHERREMMMFAHRRQEELKKLDENDDISYLNSSWADNLEVKRKLHGVDTISWKPK